MIDRELIADIIASSMNRYAPGDNSPRGALLRAADAILEALTLEYVMVVKESTPSSEGFKPVVIQDPRNPTQISDEAAQAMAARHLAHQVARAQAAIVNSNTRRPI